MWSNSSLVSKTLHRATTSLHEADQHSVMKHQLILTKHADHAIKCGATEVARIEKMKGSRKDRRRFRCSGRRVRDASTSFDFASPQHCCSAMSVNRFHQLTFTACRRAGDAFVCSLICTTSSILTSREQERRQRRRHRSDRARRYPSLHLFIEPGHPQAQASSRKCKPAPEQSCRTLPHHGSSPKCLRRPKQHLAGNTLREQRPEPGHHQFRQLPWTHHGPHQAFHGRYARGQGTCCRAQVFRGGVGEGHDLEYSDSRCAALILKHWPEGANQTCFALQAVS